LPDPLAPISTTTSPSTTERSMPSAHGLSAELEADASSRSTSLSLFSGAAVLVWVVLILRCPALSVPGQQRQRHQDDQEDDTDGGVTSIGR